MKTIANQIENRFLDVTVEQATADFNYWVENLADWDLIEDLDEEDRIEMFFNEDEDYTADMNKVNAKKEADIKFDEEQKLLRFKSAKMN